MSNPPNVGNGLTAPNAGWTFSGETAHQFSDHIRTSVPLYDEGHQLVCELSDFFVRDNSTCYDIGSSVGELTAKLATHHVNKPNVRWVGIDSEIDMVQKATDSHTIPNLSFTQDDCGSIEYEKTDLIVAYYTIQFVPPHRRQELLTKLYNALNWGGALILFEKVRGADARFQDIATTLYTDFKLKNGYSPDEIISKTRSLKGVLEPFSTQGNLDLLKRAGFVDVMTVMKYVCFEGFLAIK